MRTLRLAAVLATLALVVLCAELIVQSLSIESYRGRLERELSAALGLAVELRGELHLELVPRARFEASDVTVANLPGRPSPHLARIGTLDLDFALWPLLRGVRVVEGLVLEDVEVRIEAGAGGGFPLRPDLARGGSSGSQRPIDLRIAGVRFANLDLFYSAADGTGVSSLHFEELALDSAGVREPVQVRAIGAMDGSPFDLRGRCGSLQELLEPTAPFPVDLRGRLLEVDLELEGSLATPLELRGLDLAFRAALPGLATLPRQPQRALPRIGPLVASGRLHDAAGTLGVERLVVATEEGAGVQLDVRGAVADLETFAGVDLEVRLAASDPGFLQPLVERPLPPIGALEIAARLRDREGKLGARGELRARREGELTLHLAGSSDDLSRREGIDLQLALEARDLGVVRELIGLERELPRLGPVAARARVRGREASFGLDAVEVSLGEREGAWLEARGSLADALALRGVEVELSFGAADLGFARPYLQREPPDVGPVEGSAVWSDADGSLGLERLRARGGREGLFEVEVSGSFDDVPALDEIALEVALEARDLAVVGELLGAELPAIGPVAFSGRIHGSDERLSSQGWTRLDRTRLEGSWTAAFAPGTRPRLDAELRSPHVHLDDVGIAPVYTERPDRVVEPGATLARARDEALPFEQLRAFDADVALLAERVTGRAGFEARDVRTTLHLRDGELEIGELAGMSDGGSVRARLRVDARTPQPALTLEAEIRELDLTRLMSQFQADTEHAGLLDLLVDLHTVGRTPRELRAHLSGRLQTMLREGTLAPGFARAFVRDFSKVVLPSWRAPPVAPLSCGVVVLQIEEGVASVDTLLLQGGAVDVFGGGRIDLAGDAYHLRLTPRVKDPGLVSVAVTVDVSGPLAAPRYTPVPRSFATSLAEGLARNALKPAQVILAPLGLGGGAREDVCADPLRARGAAEDDAGG